MHAILLLTVSHSNGSRGKGVIRTLRPGIEVLLRQGGFYRSRLSRARPSDKKELEPFASSPRR